MYEINSNLDFLNENQCIPYHMNIYTKRPYLINIHTLNIIMLQIFTVSKWRMEPLVYIHSVFFDVWGRK